MKIGILTVSDRAAAELYEDKSGPLIASMLSERTPWQVTRQEVVPDELEAITAVLRQWSSEGLNLILTSGGTGFAPRDITPEATRQVIERETPGIPEALRAASLQITQHAMLSRGIAGIRSQTLIINLPGSPKAVKENLTVLLPVLPHALNLLADSPTAEEGHRAV